MKYLSKKAYEYMNVTWDLNNSSLSDDITMFWNEGESEMVAVLLVDAGAVQPNCLEAIEMISVTRQLTEQGRKRKTSKVLKNYNIFECNNCNYHHFVSKDTLVTVCESCDDVLKTKKKAG